VPPELGLGLDLSPDNLLRGFIWLVALILSASVHEAAHAWMAYRKGDGTAKYQGRLTLDPLAHIDPIGTIIMPMFIFLTGFPVFGWARPVPVNIYNLDHPSRDWMLVALAGPVSNIIQGIIWLIIFKIYTMLVPFYLPALIDVFNGFGPLINHDASIGDIALVVVGFFIYRSIWVNFLLAVFNMIPVPPLDGSRILNHFLPPSGQDVLRRIEPYGALILIGLLALGIAGLILSPVVNLLYDLLFWVAGV